MVAEGCCSVGGEVKPAQKVDYDVDCEPVRQVRKVEVFALRAAAVAVGNIHDYSIVGLGGWLSREDSGLIELASEPERALIQT